jgi:radical SAM-linked protein
MQRLRVRFCRGEELKFISHLDLMRLWQRALVRAQIALAYSEGFNPRPRISLAAPLPVGVTSEAELMDVFCQKQFSPHWFASAVGQQLPPGVAIAQVYSIDPSQPSLQSQVRFAEYRVEVEAANGPPEMGQAIAGLLAAEHLPWQHQRDTGPRHYDLRALIDDLWLIGVHQPYFGLGMRLRCDSGGSGRPEQVTLALGLAGHPQSIHRTRLILQTS